MRDLTAQIEERGNGVQPGQRARFRLGATGWDRKGLVVGESHKEFGYPDDGWACRDENDGRLYHVPFEFAWPLTAEDEAKIAKSVRARETESEDPVGELSQRRDVQSRAKTDKARKPKSFDMGDELADAANAEVSRAKKGGN